MLVTVPELEAYLERTIGANLGGALIGAATAMLERECARTFAEQVFTNEYLSGDGGPNVWLRNAPIISITSLTLYDQASKADIQTLAEGTDYILDTDTGRIEARTGYWPRGSRNMRATYTGGYAAVPDDLKVLCMDIAAYLDSQKGTHGIASESIGRYSTTRAHMVPDDLKRRMDAFRKVIF